MNLKVAHFSSLDLGFDWWQDFKILTGGNKTIVKKMAAVPCRQLPKNADGETVPLLRDTITLIPVSTKGTEKSMASERSSLIVREPTAMTAFLYTTCGRRQDDTVVQSKSCKVYIKNTWDILINFCSQMKLEFQHLALSGSKLNKYLAPFPNFTFDCYQALTVTKLLPVESVRERGTTTFYSIKPLFSSVNGKTAFDNKSHRQIWLLKSSHLSHHAVPHIVDLLAVLPVGHQIKVVGELHVPSDFLQDVDAEAFAALFNVRSSSLGGVADGQSTLITVQLKAEYLNHDVRIISHLAS